MRFVYLLIFLFVISLLAAPCLAATVPVQKEFRDWVVTCDNLRSCIAEGADKDNPTLIVRFNREAGPRGTVSMAFYGSETNKLSLDGKTLPLTEADWYSDGTDDDTSFETDSQGEVHTLVDALRNGHKLASGEATVSLDGLSAALLLIDDVQGRIDTDSAWIRRGYKLPDTVPAAPPMPVIVANPYHGAALTQAQSDAVVAAALAQSKRVENADCDLDFMEDAPSTQAERLDEREALVLVECSRGAYQSGFRVFRVPIAQPAKARIVALPSLPGQAPQEILFNAEFDADRGTLSQYIKGRGIGDCGESAQWSFVGQDFVLIAMTSEPRCPGILLEFPAMWRSRSR